MEIVRVIDEKGAQICDGLLNELIKFESGLDDLINKNFFVNEYYKKVIDDENSYLALAIENTEPIGFVYAFREFEKNTSFIDDVIEIDGLFVKEKYRSLGIGTKLIKSVETWAKQTYGSAYIEITYLSPNLVAEKCYKKYGFEPAKVTLRKKAE